MNLKLRDLPFWPSKLNFTMAFTRAANKEKIKLNEPRRNERGSPVQNNGTISQESFYLMQDLFSDMSSRNGTVVISAARGTEAANEGGKIAKGWFSHCVMTSLADPAADKNGDGKLSVNEMKAYVNDKLTTISEGKQTPTSRQDLLEIDWEVK